MYRYLRIAAFALSILGVNTPHSRGEQEFNPRTVVRPMPAITKAPTVAAREVTGEVVDGELVLGVVVNGSVRAYPINMLTGPSREIINDTLGGQAIAATW